jgi:hypothetical protein
MGGDGKELYSSLRKLSRTQSVLQGKKQYDPKLHAVTDKIKRPDKVIFVPNGQKDPVRAIHHQPKGDLCRWVWGDAKTNN